MSGASLELSTIGAVFWICSKSFSSNFTLTPGCVCSNSLIAWFHATPMALSGAS
jgi:hypothetical protein